MIPVLFDSSATSFTTNGVGRLSDAIECTVTEERNGMYELYLKYPITGKYFSSIAISSIICAVPAPGKGNQPFRVYRISKPIDGICEIYAEHISYELNSIPVMPYTAGTALAALQGAISNAAQTCPFTAWTDKTAAARFKLTEPRSFREILGGVEGSILDVFGKGEYEFDGYTIKLYVNRGTDRGVSIRYGKNLTDLTMDTDISETITGICPYWRNDETGETVTIPEYAVWSPTADNFPYKRTAVIDFTGDFEEQPTVAQLRARAEKYITDNDIGIPKVNLEVSFVPLNKASGVSIGGSSKGIVFPATINGDTVTGIPGDVSGDTLNIEGAHWEITPEDYKVLERIYLCDTVSVIYTALGVTASAKVVKTVHNVLEDRYDSVELGEPKTTLNDAVYKPVEEALTAQATAERNFLQAAIDHQTELITGGLGGYVVMNLNADGEPQEILIMDTPDTATATNVIRMNKNGIGFSTTGYAGQYTSAWTIDGHFNADFITAGTINANLIKAGLLSDINGNTSLNLSTGELTTKKLTISADGLTEKIQYQWVYDIANVSGNFSWTYKPAITNTYYGSGSTAVGNDAYFVGQYGLAESHLTTKNIHQKITGVRLNKADLNTSGTPTAGYVQVERLGSYSTSTPMAQVTGCYDIENPNTPEYYSYLSKTMFRYGGYDSNSSYIYVDPGSGINIRCGDGSDRVATIEALSNVGAFRVYLHGRSSTPLLRLVVGSNGTLSYAQILGQNIQLSSGSSKRYKHDVKELGADLDPHKLLELKPKQFVFNDGHPLQYKDMVGQTIPGFIAEEVAEVYPSAVIHDNETGEVENWDERRIIPGMLALIQEQAKKIEQLEQRIKYLEKITEVEP